MRIYTGTKHTCILLWVFIVCERCRVMTECLYMCQVALNWLWSHTLLLPDFTFSLSPIMQGGVCACLSASVCACVCLRASLIHYWAAPDVVLLWCQVPTWSPSTEPRSARIQFQRLRGSFPNLLLAPGTVSASADFPIICSALTVDGSGQSEMHLGIFPGVLLWLWGGTVLLSFLCLLFNIEITIIFIL